MKKLLSIALLLLASKGWGVSTVFNSCTGCPDYVGSGATLPLPPGATNYAQINPSSQQAGVVSVSSVNASGLSLNGQINLSPPYTGAPINIFANGPNQFAQNAPLNLYYSALGNGTTTSILNIGNAYEVGTLQVEGWNFQNGAGTTMASIDVASGQIQGSGVSVSTVTASSMTVQNITINGTCMGSGCGGGSPKVYTSSSTVFFQTTSNVFQPILPSSFTVTTAKAANKWMYCVSGDVYTTAGAGNSYLTVFKDSQNLGPSSGFMATQVPGVTTDTGASFCIMDSPGDTNPHTYVVELRANNNGNGVGFSDNATATYILLEIPQ